MRGLLLAEVGDSMVEFDVYGKPGESGYRVGQRIATESLVPRGSSKLPHLPERSSPFQPSTSATLFDADITQATQSGTEIKTLLGNSNSRLKPGVTVHPHPALRNTDSNGDLGTDFKPIALEKARWRSRVEVDIILENHICVQGSYLKGTANIHIKKGSKKDAPLLLSQGKVRVVGFECIPQKDSKCTFYKYSALLSEIAPSWKGLFKSLPDDDGWAEVQEGVYVFPFAMLLPSDGGCGIAKGVLSINSGVAIKYVAMVEVKVKDSATSEESIAHFYRDCEIWPRLDVAATRVFMGGPGKIRLLARIHRFYWVAGQSCTVHFRVVNDCKKLVKCAAIALIRTVTVAGDVDPDACQTLTKVKRVTESILELGQRCSKGHTSAKGWWTGVAPGQTSEFDHSLILPPDVHSISRTRLLEVEYTLRISRKPWYRKSRVTSGDLVETDETVPGMKYARDITIAIEPDDVDEVPVLSEEQHQDPNTSADSASIYPPSQSADTIEHRENLLHTVSEEDIAEDPGTPSGTANFARHITASSSAIEPHILTQLELPQAESTQNTTFLSRRIEERMQSQGASWVIVKPFTERRADAFKTQKSHVSKFGSSSMILPRPPAISDDLQYVQRYQRCSQATDMSMEGDLL
ncbi:hypothetical protein BDR07DRAFT_1469433 [Suillus spraguei]|nr:hypothetical protein BDR07DRAFT_1469433 [Suillus spraguei]